MHCLVNLQDGRVMILGSQDYNMSKSVMIFDPSKDYFQLEPPLIHPRRDPACTLLYSTLHENRPVVLAAGGLYQDTGS